MTNKLQQYFPMLRTREEIIHEIEHRPNLRRTFYNWSEKARNEFLDFTTGAKGVKMMYDFASKELLNPETHRERVNEFLSLLLGQPVKILEVLALLQKYLFVPLDIFKEIKHNESIPINLKDRREAWPAFLCMDDPEDILVILEQYPDFKECYEQVYEICRNIEEVMSMFSKELAELDRNTTEFMIDRMQKEIDQQAEKLKEKDRIIAELQATNESLKKRKI